MEWFGSRGGYTIMFPRTMVRWGFGLAVVLLATSSAYGGEYQFDTWHFTPSADTEYKVDIYGVRPPTLSTPYETWVLLHDDHSFRSAGYVPEFDSHRWHLTLNVHHPDMVAAYGNVYSRTNGCAWQAVGQISGQFQPGLMGEDAGRDGFASTTEPAQEVLSVALEDSISECCVAIR